MFRFLQEMGANFGKLALLLDRHDWLRLIEPVSDEVMQLLPVIQLQGEETKLVFEPFISHDYDCKLTSSSVSSINRCAQGTIDCLQPADDPFLEVKTALSPSKNLRQRRFAFQ